MYNGGSLTVLFPGTGALTEKLLTGPLEVVMGLGYGMVVGVLLWFLPGLTNSRLSLLRLLLLTCAGLLALFGSQKVGEALWGGPGRGMGAAEGRVERRGTLSRARRWNLDGVVSLGWLSVLAIFIVVNNIQKSVFCLA